MCAIIDTCVLGCVFEASSKKHNHFKPLYDWITCGRGKLVFGGTKYTNELKSAQKYLGIFTELNRSGRVRKLCNKTVDAAEKEVIKLDKNKKFNDQHLIAIVLVSGCMIIATDDKECMPFLKDPKFYKKSIKRPKIYNSSRNKKLLSDKYIADICKN